MTAPDAAVVAMPNAVTAAAEPRRREDRGPPRRHEDHEPPRRHEDHEPPRRREHHAPQLALHSTARRAVCIKWNGLGPLKVKERSLGTRTVVWSSSHFALSS
jgi:hypothetical protein